MLYWLGTVTDGVIGGYDIEDGKIYITYLNGEVKEIPLSDDAIKTIQDYMIAQAQERDKNFDITSLKSFESNLQIKAFLNLFIGSLLTTASVNTDVMANKIIFLVASICNIFSVKKKMTMFKTIKSLIEDVYKYKFFLNMRDSLKDGSNPDVFRGIVDPPKDGISINDVDDYSLNEMITINNNLARKRWKDNNN